MRYRQRGRAAVAADDRHEFHVRQWLNLPRSGGSAYIHVRIERDPGYRETDFDLELADCSRRIFLAFDIEGRGERLNSLAKLDVLIDAATRFREHLFRRAVDEARRERAERRRKREEARSPELASSGPAPASAPEATPPEEIPA